MVRLLDELVGRPRGARAPRRRAAVHGQPLRRDLHRAHDDHAAGDGGAAVDAALRAPRAARAARLWWPALFALVVTSSGGGVNVAVTAWILLGPLLLAGYEVACGGIEWRAVRALAVRLIPLAAIASLWWVARGASCTRATALDFLPYTEQPGTIWGDDVGARVAAAAGVLDELHRRRLHGHAARLPVRRGRLPRLRAGGARHARAARARARRPSGGRAAARYAPLFLALALVGLLVMFAGFPEGTPLRHAATFTYNHVQGTQLPAHHLQGGPAASRSASRAWRRWRSRALRPARAAVGAPRRPGACSSRSAAGRSCAAWPSTASSASATCPRRGRAPRATSTARCPPATARWCSRASCSPTTAGAARSTRSCPR